MPKNCPFLRIVSISAILLASCITPPGTEKAVDEIVRVVRPGGELKIMLYNRHSIYAFNQWVKYALFRGKPWKTLKWILWHHMESMGTKGYTRNELSHWLQRLPLEGISVHTEITSADYLSASAIPPLNVFYRLVLRCAGYSRDVGSELVC